MGERLENQLLSSISGFDGGSRLGQTVFSDPEAIATLERAGNSAMPLGRIDLGPLCSRDEVVAMIESGSWGGSGRAAAPDVDVGHDARVGPYAGIRAQPQDRRRTLLDLCETATMDSGSFFYGQEQGNLDTAAEVAEGQIKPVADLQIVDAEVVAQTIAHWLRLKRPQLADVPALGTTASRRLIDGVFRRLDKQVLNGTGTGVNLRGILQTSGIGSIPFSAAGPLSDLVIDGITATFLSDAEPNGVVAHPTDVGAMLKATADTSGARLDSGGAFATPPTEMWGLPLVISKGIAQGMALLGDFRQATVFVREGVTLRASDSDQDAFVRNEVVLLAEGRFGLAVWQPSAFTTVDLKA